MNNVKIFIINLKKKILLLIQYKFQDYYHKVYIYFIDKIKKAIEIYEHVIYNDVY